MTNEEEINMEVGIAARNFVNGLKWLEIPANQRILAAEAFVCGVKWRDENPKVSYQFNVLPDGVTSERVFGPFDTVIDDIGSKTGDCNCGRAVIFGTGHTCKKESAK